jgi:hypothetical protein
MVLEKWKEIRKPEPVGCVNPEPVGCVLKKKLNPWAAYEYP